MTIETELYTRLTTHAGLSALIGTRAYPLHLPQKPTLPAVTYHRVSAIRVSAMGADTGLVRPRFQIDVWAEEYITQGATTGAREVAEQVRAALQRWSTSSGTIVQDSYFLNEVELFEPDTELVHIALDFEINYEE